MNRLFKGACGAAMLLGLATGPVEAQQVETPEQSGTAGAEFLLLPVTARSASLASTQTGGLSSMSGLEALQANPAALTVNQGTNGLFSRMDYVAGIGVNHFGVAQSIGSSQIALTITSWDFGDDLFATSEDDPLNASETFDATNVSAGLTYARMFTDRISAGLTAKLNNESIDDLNATYVSFDAGMTYVVGESGLRLGVALKNFGPQMSFGGNGLAVFVPNQTPDGQPSGSNAGLIETAGSELPSLLNFGVTYTREFAQGLSASVLGNFRSNANAADQYSGGLELGFQNLIFLRGGFELREDMDQSFYEGWNVGGGIGYDFADFSIAVDYAYRPVEYFDGVNLFTAAITL